jgi:hypothetical protein
MSKGLISLGHSVSIFPFLNRFALALGRIQKLRSELFPHAPLALARSSVLDDPTDT